MFTVYKHTSPSNKVYIGITCQKPKSRWKNGNGYAHSPHFLSAIKKYGWDNFKHEILFENLSHDEAEKKEVELIKEYRSTDRKYGYNADSGGNVLKQHSEETKRKIGEAHKGMKYGEDFKEKVRKASLGNKNALGHKKSAECKRKASERMKGKYAGDKNYFHSHIFRGKDNKMSKPVDKLDLDGNFIESRECAEAFSKEMGKHNAIHITEVCRGKRKTAYGFKWRFHNGGNDGSV